jgi:hypothetical protein
MTGVIASIDAEYRRYKSLAEAAMRQLTEPQLSEPGPNGGNSVAVLVWHVAGNLKSRFTDFLTADGEKPWRDRESEFGRRTVTRSELLAKWEDGWGALLGALQGLRDEHLRHSITIRGVSLTVPEALHRSLAHTSYHVGQIVYLAKCLRGEGWTYLSIPPGQSDQYNKRPTGEKASEHAAAVDRRVEKER